MISKAIIKNIQSLQLRKHRDEAGMFVAEGSVVLAEMLAEGQFPVHSIYATENWWRSLALDVQKKYEIKCTIIDGDMLQRISGRKTAQGGLTIFLKPSLQNDIDRTGWLLALDKLQDPGNLGTIIRTCDWFGIKQIICSEDSADCYAPKVVQSAMASLGRVDVRYMSLNHFFQNYKLPVYGAFLKGENVHTVTNNNAGCILMGNEANGINESLHTFITNKITIPGKGKTESLNVGIAAGIIMDRLCN